MDNDRLYIVIKVWIKLRNHLEKCIKKVKIRKMLVFFQKKN